MIYTCIHKKNTSVHDFILVYTCIYHVQTCMVHYCIFHACMEIHSLVTQPAPGSGSPVDDMHCSCTPPGAPPAPPLSALSPASAPTTDCSPCSGLYCQAPPAPSSWPPRRPRRPHCAARAAFPRIARPSHPQAPPVPPICILAPSIVMAPPFTVAHRHLVCTQASCPPLTFVKKQSSWAGCTFSQPSRASTPSNLQ
jgi:hypothetical protein